VTQAGAFRQIKADSGSRLCVCLPLLKAPGQNSRPGRGKINAGKIICRNIPRKEILKSKVHAFLTFLYGVE
jgi:hypothetical protein